MATEQNHFGNRPRQYRSVNPTEWADAETRAYIERLESEVTRLDAELRAMHWRLAAAYEEGDARGKLEQIREVLDA